MFMFHESKRALFLCLITVTKSAIIMIYMLKISEPHEIIQYIL